MISAVGINNSELGYGAGLNPTLLDVERLVVSKPCGQGNYGFKVPFQ